MPPGGAGYYYFSVFLTVDGDEAAYFDVELNGDLLCTVYGDLSESVAYAVEGIHDKKKIYVVHIIVNKELYIHCSALKRYLIL